MTDERNARVKHVKSLTQGRAAVDMMRHAVGWLYRNVYCAERNSPEHGQWLGLVVLGLAKAGAVINEERDQYFHVTPAGIAYLAKLEQPTVEEKVSRE